MKANELRIGNLIKAGIYGNVKIICFIYDEIKISINPGTIDRTIHFKVSECEPIELTEEWLLKFGFEKCDSPCEQGYTNGIYKLFSNSIGEINICLMDFNDWYICLEYVHSLQNLYFALTSEELTIRK